MFMFPCLFYPVSDLAPGQMGIDDMKMLEQKAQQLAAEAEQDKPKPKEKILFVRFVHSLSFHSIACLFFLTEKLYIKPVQFPWEELLGVDAC